MPVTLNVSTLAQSKTQSNRLAYLGRELDNLQRQVTTGKKYETYTDFGTQSYSLQNLRTTAPKIETYMQNIDKVSTDMEQMISLTSRITTIATEVKSAVNLRDNSEAGIESLAEFAKAQLEFIQEILNAKGIDSSYLFAGGNITDAPFVNNTQLQGNYRNQVDGWFNGTITTEQLTNNSDAFTATNIGFSASLGTSAGRIIQINDGLSVDYSIKADIEGIQEIVKTLALVANMKYPDGAAVGTVSQMDDIFSYASQTLSKGVTNTNNEIQKLSSKFSFIKSIGENHQKDAETYKSQIDDIENINPSDALVRMQLLLTQLETSYQVTSMVSQMSLVNYMR